MIFHKSLSKKKGAAYSFFSGISAGFVPAVLILLLQTLLMAGLPLLTFIETDFGSRDSQVGEILLSKDKFKFLTYGLTGTTELYFVFAILGILSIVLAVRLFSFICDKKTVNVFYSLGIKRSTLFMSKYAAGALLLIGATIVPVILSYIVNLIFLGASWQLSLVLLHLYCGLSVFVLVCFSVAAVVFSSVGTVSEAIVYSAALLFAPTIIIFLSEQIIGAFLPSSTINDSVNIFGSLHRYYYENVSASLIERTSDYNPLLFFVKELSAFSRGLLDKGELELSINGESADWYFPKIFIHFPWFIIALGLGVLGALLFKRIKAENCGFLNTNKVLSNLTIFELCLLGSCVLLSELEWTETWIVIASGAAAAFALYLIAEIFLKRNFLKILKSLYKFVAHIGVIAIIYGICATGLFGYSDYIPDRSRIQSASIYAPLSYSQITTTSAATNWNQDWFIRVYEPYNYGLLPEMTDSADIDKIVEINKLAIENEKDDGFHSDIIIRYTLENGSISERKHTLTSRQEMMSLLGLVDTKAYNDEIYKLFYGSFGEEDIKKEYNLYGWVDPGYLMKLAFNYKYSEVSVKTSSLMEEKVLKLTEEEWKTLRDAVYKDITTQSLEDYFYGSKKQLGVLSFGINSEAHAITDENIYVYDDEMVTVPSAPVTLPEEDVSLPDDMTDELFPDEEIIPEEESKYEYTSYIQYQELGGFRSDSTYDVVISEDMVNTISALNSMGLGDCFKNEAAIESVSFREYDISEIFSYYVRSDESTYIHDFFAYSMDKSEFWGMEDEKNPEELVSENKITDKAKLSELDSLMKLHEYTFNEGYFCLIKYSDGNYTVKYLSREDAPDYVNNFNYVMNGQEIYYY